MKESDMLAAIGASNDQDREAAKQWLREATVQDKFRVWMTIQKPYDDPTVEIMSRFAQLAFGELVVEVAKEAKRDAAKFGGA